RWLARAGARHPGHGGAGHPHPSRCAHANAADAGTRGGPFRDPPCVAHWGCRGPCAVGWGPGAWPRGWGGGGGGGGRARGGGGGWDMEWWGGGGWLRSLFPVRLDVGGVDVEEALAGGAGLGRALKLIKEQLRAVPGNGLGYGLLRYLNARTGLQLSGFAAPQIGFNYLGRFAGPAGADWGRAAEAVRLGDGGDAAMPLAHCLEVNALTLDGAQGAELTAHWSWAPALVTEAEVRDLA